jgi:hypothetical protein
MDLLTIYAHDWEVQVITAPPLIPTIHKLPQHRLSLFPPAVSSVVPWQRLLTVEIHALKSSLNRLPYETEPVAPVVVKIIPRADHVQTSRFQQYPCCSASILFCRNMFTEPLPRNVSGIFDYLAVVT